MISSESLPIMTQTVANNTSLYNNRYQAPTTRLTLEQQYQDMARQLLPNQQQQLSNPYDDYIQTLNSVSDVTKQKITQDERFQVIYLQCTEILNQSLYAKVLPEVLSDQNGRIAFERLYTTTKALKDELVQKDIQKEKTLDLLMQDEVVLRRLQELQNPQSSSPIQTSTQSTNVSQIASQAPQSTSTQSHQTSAQNINNNGQKNNHKNNQNQKPQNGGAE